MRNLQNPTSSPGCGGQECHSQHCSSMRQVGQDPSFRLDLSVQFGPDPGEPGRWSGFSRFDRGVRQLP